MEEFFIEYRLKPMINQLFDRGIFSQKDLKTFEKLYSQIEFIFPKEKPALLHGDLWSGNYFSNKNGSPVIFDPAVYFGHREMDVAMTKLFGGFPPELYEIYNEIYPLEKGWTLRIDLCNLYPILVHANLFGGHYSNQSLIIARRFT